MKAISLWKSLAIFILLAIHGCEECPAMDRFAALSQIESGDRDAAIGADGEISRYQILVMEWRRASSAPLSRALDSASALAVAQAIMSARCTAFAARRHRPPTDFEFYLLWHRPARVLNPKHREAARAQRFANLCTK